MSGRVEEPWAPGPGENPFRLEPEGPDKPTEDEVDAAREALRSIEKPIADRRRSAIASRFVENFLSEIPNVPNFISGLPVYRQRQLDLAVGNLSISSKLVRLWVAAKVPGVNAPITRTRPAEEEGAAGGLPNLNLDRSDSALVHDIRGTFQSPMFALTVQFFNFSPI